ncbi:MAG: hypothetical protein ABSA85_04370 [Terracidiphilus sp.]
MSSRLSSRLWITAGGWGAVLLLIASAALPIAAQYPGQITTTAKNAPTLRAVAVFEWTGDEAKPTKSRLVPVCIYDGQELQDADVYLARPFPLALSSDVEYLLLQDGKPLGLFDIETAAREEGSWVGYGKHLPMPVAKPAPKQVAKIDADDDSQSDTPILHRKHHAGDAGSGSGGSSGGSSTDSAPDPNAPPPDPDRPTLHKGGDASAGNSGDSSNTNSGSNTSSTSSTQPPSSDGPTLHRAGDASSGDSSSNSGNTSGSNGPTLHKGGDASGSGNSDTSNSGSPSDPDRPVLHRTPDSTTSSSAGSSDSDRPTLIKKKNEDESSAENNEAYRDPDRPRLFRGKSAGFDGPVTPSLLGLPHDMHQEVAVSDVADRPEHVWDYIWANPDDEARMKAAMEDLARTALGLNPPPAPAKPAPKTKTASTAHKPKQLTLPPQPSPLVDEQFHIFELAYGSGATMVLSAHTEATGAQQKFVTLIAQPDLYGNVSVLVKNVTDVAHLDETPRMRLVDAVDALADNRGELLFELRGSTQRQFALYRVLRGDATRIFLSNADAIVVPTGE